MDLFIFDNAVKDTVISALLENDHITAMRKIIEFSESVGVTANGVKEYVVTRLAEDDNILSQMAQSDKNIGEDLYRYAYKDIERIYNEIFLNLNSTYRPSGNTFDFYNGYVRSIKNLENASSPKELLEKLIIHYETLGTGMFAKYVAFKFDGELKGVENIDKITFDDLIGLEYQKSILSDNTEAFLKGRRANNVLLFGDRGTGKSSCVKALLNMYYNDGLRVIEMPKYCIKDIPRLSKELSQKPHKYIIYLDDLSFDSHETDYRALKIAMEGQLQSNPSNVLIYATSNRRHLIKETWADREGGEIHKNDNIQETLSLSERFGISLSFSAPETQKAYLNIVAKLLKVNGIDITPEIERSAIIWQMNFGSRSPRCANQFVASYVSKVK